MKKWLLLTIVLLAGTAAGAQNRFYAGGDISLTASSSGTRIVVYPEFGKRVNDNLYVGLAAGGGYSTYGGHSDFTLGLTPHVRGYWYFLQDLGLSGDLFASFRATRRRGYEPLIKTFETGIRPGVVFPVGGGTCITAQVGFFGWSRTDYGDGNPSSRWLARVEARDIIIGVLLSL